MRHPSGRNDPPRATSSLPTSLGLRARWRRSLRPSRRRPPRGSRWRSPSPTGRRRWRPSSSGTRCRRSLDRTTPAPRTSSIADERAREREAAVRGRRDRHQRQAPGLPVARPRHGAHDAKLEAVAVFVVGALARLGLRRLLAVARAPRGAVGGAGLDAVLARADVLRLRRAVVAVSRVARRARRRATRSVVLSAAPLDALVPVVVVDVAPPAPASGQSRPCSTSGHASTNWSRPRRRLQPATDEAAASRVIAARLLGFFMAARVAFAPPLSIGRRRQPTKPFFL